LFTLQEAEAVCGPAKTWKFRCFEIASKIVAAKLVSGRAVYGHYLGPIARKSPFKQWIGLPFVRHGWIRRRNGEIVDPTLWVFLAEKPHIFVGERKMWGHLYNEGGQNFRKAISGPYPDPWQPNGKGRPIHRLRLPKVFAAEFDISDEVSDMQACWIANLPISAFGPYAERIYASLRRHGCKAFIPIDNWRAVMGVD
jgi:hypothetical protein